MGNLLRRPRNPSQDHPLKIKKSSKSTFYQTLQLPSHSVNPSDTVKHDRHDEVIYENLQYSQGTSKKEFLSRQNSSVQSYNRLFNIVETLKSDEDFENFNTFLQEKLYKENRKKMLLYTNDDNRNVFHVACKNGNKDVLGSLLIEAKRAKVVDIVLNEKDSQELFTPLHVACVFGHAEIVELFFVFDESILCCYNNLTHNFLQMACVLRIQNVIDIVLGNLLTKKVLWKLFKKTGTCNPLEYSYGNETLRTKVQRILGQSYGKFLEEISEISNIVERACILRQTNDLTGLLPESLKEKNDRGETALHIACRNGFIEGIEAIMEISEQLNSELLKEKDKAGNTPLHLTLLYGNGAFIQTLMERDINLVMDTMTVTNRDDRTILHMACDDNSSDHQIAKYILRSLIYYTAIWNATILLADTHGSTVLHLAKKSGDIKLVNLLLYVENSKLLLKQDGLGHTALCYALLGNDAKMVRVILDSAKNLYVLPDLLIQDRTKNVSNIVLWTCAQQGIKAECFQVLLDYVESEDKKLLWRLLFSVDYEGNSFLFYINKANPDVIKLLIQKACQFLDKNYSHSALTKYEEYYYFEIDKCLTDQTLEKVDQTSELDDQSLELQDGQCDYIDRAHAGLIIQKGKFVRKTIFETVKQESNDELAYYFDEIERVVDEKQASREVPSGNRAHSEAPSKNPAPDENETLSAYQAHSGNEAPSANGNTAYKYMLFHDSDKNEVKRDVLETLGRENCIDLMKHKYTKGYLKWACSPTILGIIWVSFVLSVLMSVTFTLHVWGHYFHTINGTMDVVFTPSTQERVFWYIFIAFVVLNLLYEAMLFISTSKEYFKKIESYLRILVCLCCLFVFVVQIFVPYNFWQHHIAILTAVYSWLIMAWKLTKIAIFGENRFAKIVNGFSRRVLMLLRVTYEVVKYVPVFFVCNLGFAFIYGSLYQEQPPFDYYGHAIMKLLAMTVGEVEFDELFFGEIRSPFQALGFIVFIIFICVMTISVMNLFIALTIGEIDKLQKESKCLAFLNLVHAIEEAQQIRNAIRRLFNNIYRYCKKK